MSGFAFSLTLHLLAGVLPKQLPTSLEVLTLGEYIDNTNKFTGEIPSEWGALTNLKSLKIVACGLDGNRSASALSTSYFLCADLRFRDFQAKFLLLFCAGNSSRTAPLS